MKTEQTKDIITRLYEAVNSKDIDYLRSLGFEKSEWREVPYDFTFKGPDAIGDPWASWFKIFPDATCEVQKLTVLEDHVIAMGIGRGTHEGDFDSPAGVLPPSGVKMMVNFCDVYQLENGKILRADSYFDFYGLLKQLAPFKIA